MSPARPSAAPAVLVGALLLLAVACGPEPVEPWDPRVIEADIPGVVEAMRGGDPRAALAEIDRLVAEGAAPAGVEHYRGLALADLGRTEDALAAFLAELATHPGNGRAHGMAADALIELGRLEEAQVHVDAGRRLATDFPYLVLVAGRLAYLTDDAPLARNAFETYLSVDAWSPLAAEAHHVLSLLAAARGEADVARDHAGRSDHLERVHQYLNRYRERLAEDPDDTDAALGVAKVFLDLFQHVAPDGDFLGQAEGALARVLEQRPDDVAALFNMGFVRTVQERYDEALAYYAEAAALDDAHAGARLSAGKTLALLGRHEEALPVLEVAAAVNRGDAPAMQGPGAFLHAVDASGRQGFLRSWLARARLGDAARRTFVRADGAWDQPALLAELFARAEAHALLCVTRHGWRPTSVDAVNAWMHREVAAEPRWVAGEPVVVTRNDYERGLFNGDRGVLLWVAPASAAPPRISAVFRRDDGFVAHPLEAVRGLLELGWATTVHKAQGSEHDEVALLLPAQDHPRLLTREVVYTAITRARRRVHVVGDPGLLARAVRRRIERRTGIGALLAQPPWGGGGKGGGGGSSVAQSG